MGPVFYLVQCEEELLLISAVVLGNWPHEFALAPSPGKKGGRTAAGSVCAGCPRPRPAAGKKKLFYQSSVTLVKPWREIRAIWTVRSAALCC